MGPGPEAERAGSEAERGDLQIGLTSYTLHAPNSEDYYEMPCYVVYYDPWQRPDSSRNDKTTMQETLLINAVDGSIVHTDYGY